MEAPAGMEDELPMDEALASDYERSSLSEQDSTSLTGEAWREDDLLGFSDDPEEELEEGNA